MSEFRVLTVCTGNVHRSAFAAVMIRTWTRWYLPAKLAAEVHVSSAGTGAAVGSPMDPTVLAVISALGGDGSAHRARQLDEREIASADLVLTASRFHRDAVLARVPSTLRRVFTIREAGRVAAGRQQVSLAGPDAMRAIVSELADRRFAGPSAKSDDIADPQGLGAPGFARMAAQELPPLVDLAGALFGMSAADATAYLSVADDPAFLRIPLG